jgi:hypothetical protein
VAAAALTTLVAAALLLLAGGCNKNDLSTPKGAAKSFAKALESGDAEAAKAASTGDPKLVESLAKVGGGMKKLQDAAVAKFGEEGKSIAGGPGGKGDKMAEMSKRVEESTEKIDGDTATLTPKDGGEALKLKKVNGDWKLDVSQMGGGMAQMGSAMFDAMAKAAGETADEISAGKYKTVKEAQMAMGTKMVGAMTAGGGDGGK